jgi:hypothetical protein
MPSLDHSANLVVVGSVWSKGYRNGSPAALNGSGGCLPGPTSVRQYGKVDRTEMTKTGAPLRSASDIQSPA